MSSKRPGDSGAEQPETKQPRLEEQQQHGQQGQGQQQEQQQPRCVHLCAACSSDKGPRQAMEDVHVCEMDAGRAEEGGTAAGSARVSFFCILDGHGGSSVASYASELLHAEAMAAGLREAASSGPGTPPTPARVDVKAAKAAILQAFTSTDSRVLHECSCKGWTDGACAVACWVMANTCFVANVGDAKAVLARVADKDGPGGVKAGALRALVLTKEHLAIHPTERQRIVKAGGFVSKEGRLQGRMQVARSFGDAALKKHGCSSTPDIVSFELAPRDKFLLLGCDGFWGVFDAQGAVEMADGLLQQGRDAKAVANRLLNEAVRERKSKDNVSVLLLVCTHPEAVAASTVGGPS